MQRDGIFYKSIKRRKIFANEIIKAKLYKFHKKQSIIKKIVVINHDFLHPYFQYYQDLSAIFYNLPCFYFFLKDRIPILYIK